MKDGYQADSAVELANWVRDNAPAHELVGISGPDGTEVNVMVLTGPTGPSIKSLKSFADEYRTNPERRTGTATMLDLRSFIAHVNRFKDDNTALFGNNDRASPYLLAVIDYHERVNVIQGDPGAQELVELHSDAHPRFGTHRTFYKFPLSDEWVAWHGHDGKQMTQGDFAAFLEDRIGDVIPPPIDEGGDADAAAAAADPMAELSRLLGGNFASPSRLLELSRGMQVHQNEKVRNAVNISTGEVQITYNAEHQDTTGAPLKVPNLFLIGIPVFRSGAPYQVAVRLRYRLREGVLLWSYQLYRADKVFDHAFDEAASKAVGETGLPMFLGSPEATRNA